jgi:hypothetical protein
VGDYCPDTTPVPPALGLSRVPRGRSGAPASPTGDLGALGAAQWSAFVQTRRATGGDRGLALCIRAEAATDVPFGDP